ncbi:MAG: hypothetical protein JF606_21790 [Burkholderiales bacterium]|nr:hypothetical protein [Burkholderiales bacterium]
MRLHPPRHRDSRRNGKFPAVPRAAKHSNCIAREVFTFDFSLFVKDRSIGKALGRRNVLLHIASAMRHEIARFSHRVMGVPQEFEAIIFYGTLLGASCEEIASQRNVIVMNLRCASHWNCLFQGLVSEARIGRNPNWHR